MNVRKKINIPNMYTIEKTLIDIPIMYTISKTLIGIPNMYTIAKTLIDIPNIPSQTKSGFFTKKRIIPEFFTKSVF